MANADLLLKTLQFIRTHPELWNQLDYRRGNQGCFALHASLLAGGQLADPAPTVLRDGETVLNHNANLVRNEVALRLGFSPDDDIHAREFATRALGMLPHQADDLFRSDNTLLDLELLIRDLTGATTHRQ
jgi:hypothetical protein